MRTIITFALSAVLAITFASCVKNGNTGNTSSTVNIVDTVVPDEGCPECEHLAFWWVRHDSINPAFVRTAESLWQFGRHGENMLDWACQVKWHDECQQVLIHAYDSIHPGKNVKDQDMRMLDELMQFFDTCPDDSKIGFIIRYDLKEKFVTYKIIHHSKAILNTQKGCLFEQEIHAWNEFSRQLTGFCCRKLILDWYGASGANAACTHFEYERSSQRLSDVERIDKYCHNAISQSQLLGKAPSNYRIENSIDSILAELKFTSSEERGISERAFAEYQKGYAEICGTRESLIDAYYNWIIVRERLFGFDNKSAKKDKMIATARALVLFEGQMGY